MIYIYIIIYIIVYNRYIYICLCIVTPKTTKREILPSVFSGATIGSYVYIDKEEELGIIGNPTRPRSSKLGKLVALSS